MALHVVDVILFHSAYSKISRECLSLMEGAELFPKVVVLDTPSSRRAAREGSLVSVTKVPSLAVELSDETVQLFVGFEKIACWVSEVKKPPKVVEKGDLMAEAKRMAREREETLGYKPDS